ncbi:MAG: DUF456 domain-containing protein [Candidatus Krumholzibacteria bacterium]|nr:DUF456 domain-containing protein [Candidatus Krumholzibacteria bacterium]
MGDILQTVGGWIWFAIWAVLLIGSTFLVYVGIGGTFVVLGLAFVHALVTGFAPIGWPLLGVLAGIAVLGEVIEFILGNFYAVGRGASAPGAIGAFLGGTVGGLSLMAALPPIGAVMGSFAGAFIGGVLGEWWRQRRLEPSLRIGSHAFVGRVLAIVVKHALGLAMVALVLRVTVPTS